MAFFDFDQSWADGDKGIVRESMMIADFDAMISTSADTVDFNFSYPWEQEARKVLEQFPPGMVESLLGFDAKGLLTDGLLPTAVFETWDWQEDRRRVVHQPQGVNPETWDWRNDRRYWPQSWVWSWLR